MTRAQETRRGGRENTRSSFEWEVLGTIMITLRGLIIIKKVRVIYTKTRCTRTQSSSTIITEDGRYMKTRGLLVNFDLAVQHLHS